MSQKPSESVIASVRQRLLNIIVKTGDNAAVVWTRFAIERLLYRLSISEFSNEFVLKGASLLAVWSREPYRSTMDLDLLGLGLDSQERVLEIFRALCDSQINEDGLLFDSESVGVTAIRESGDYHGQRVNLIARLGNARIAVQVDVAFGDVITPGVETVNYPTLLDMPAPRVKASTKQTVVAEKFQAMVFLGMINSRMKDFYDLYKLASGFQFDGRQLAEAITATFQRRKTPLPIEAPIALTEEFYNDSIKQKQWNAFVKKVDDETVSALPIVVKLLAGFILPVITATSDSGEIGIWLPSGPWSRNQGTV